MIEISPSQSASAASFSFSLNVISLARKSWMRVASMIETSPSPSTSPRITEIPGFVSVGFVSTGFVSTGFV